MERPSTPAIYRGSVLYKHLANPRKKFWKAVKDTGYFLFVGWPLLLALAVVVKEGF